MDKKRLLQDLVELHRAGDRARAEAMRGGWRFMNEDYPDAGLTNGRCFMSLEAFIDTFGEDTLNRILQRDTPEA